MAVPSMTMRSFSSRLKISYARSPRDALSITIGIKLACIIKKLKELKDAFAKRRVLRMMEQAMMKLLCLFFYSSAFVKRQQPVKLPLKKYIDAEGLIVLHTRFKRTLVINAQIAVQIKLNVFYF